MLEVARIFSIQVGEKQSFDFCREPMENWNLSAYMLADILKSS